MDEDDKKSALPTGAPSRRLRLVLGLSLAFNLLIVGLIIGAMAAGGGVRHHRMGGGGMGFSALGPALSWQDRRAMADILRDRSSVDAEAVAALRGDSLELAAGLQAADWDRAETAAILSRMAGRIADRAADRQVLMLDYLEALPPKERMALGARMEKRLMRHGGHRWWSD
ncbi:MAG: periplasmic heavy metal sensor [Paracoccaceae bacterium]